MVFSNRICGIFTAMSSRTLLSDQIKSGLQSIRSTKIFKDVSCFCTQTRDFAVSNLGIKLYELANECLSVVSTVW
jgi:hypothetical protein